MYQHLHFTVEKRPSHIRAAFRLVRSGHVHVTCAAPQPLIGSNSHVTLTTRLHWSRRVICVLHPRCWCRTLEADHIAIIWRPAFPAVWQARCSLAEGCLYLGRFLSGEIKVRVLFLYYSEGFGGYAYKSQFIIINLINLSIFYHRKASEWTKKHSQCFYSF